VSHQMTDYISLDRPATSTHHHKRSAKSHSSSTHAPQSKHSHNAVRHCIAPWKTREYSTQPMIALHQEIEDFAAFIEPRPAEIAMRQRMIDRLTEVVKEMWPMAQVECFGSSRTGLNLPTSDIDIVILGQWKAAPLQTLARKLREMPIVAEEVTVIRAKVPIVTYTDAETKLHVDISFNRVDSVSVAMDVKANLERVPPLKALIFVLKRFLAMRGLNEVFSGGLSSYALYLTVLSYWQLRPLKPENPNLGVMLLEYFELYGKNFHYAVLGISIRNGGSYFQRDTRSFTNHPHGHDQLLCIENPMDHNLDVSSGSYAMDSVRESFAHAYALLSSAAATRKPNHPQLKAATALSKIITMPAAVIDYRNWVLKYYSDTEEPEDQREKFRLVGVWF